MQEGKKGGVAALMNEARGSALRLAQHKHDVAPASRLEKLGKTSNGLSPARPAMADVLSPSRPSLHRLLGTPLGIVFLTRLAIRCLYATLPLAPSREPLPLPDAGRQSSDNLPLLFAPQCITHFFLEA